MELGLIDLPILNETYVAVRGKGAWVNGKPLHVSATESVEDSLLATGFFGDHEENLQEQLKIFSQIVRRSRGIRRGGSAAYDLTQVARGVFDAFWEKDLKPWDTAAGMLLVTEAGGKISTYRGQKYDPYRKTMLATNQKLHLPLQQLITPHLDPTSD
jgi:myo-inositol-1(or 4)-monophosphatase